MKPIKFGKVYHSYRRYLSFYTQHFLLISNWKFVWTKLLSVEKYIFLCVYIGQMINFLRFSFWYCFCCFLFRIKDTYNNIFVCLHMTLTWHSWFLECCLEPACWKCLICIWYTNMILSRHLRWFPIDKFLMGIFHALVI